MPFALIPDGYKLQKVSKAQKEAVDKFYSTDNVKAFFDGPASGELVKAAAIVVTPIVLAVLAKQGYEFVEAEAEGIVQSVVNTTGNIVDNVLVKQIIQGLGLISPFVTPIDIKN